MALLDNAWYINFGNGSSTGYYAVPQWVTLGGPYTAGAIIRQATVSPALTERCFVCYNSTSGTGVSGASEPTWGTPTRGQQYTDGTVKWEECTGVAALNGDLTNTPTWTQYRTANASATLGQVIQNGAGTLLLLCITAGAMAALGSEPSWAAYTTTGATTSDGAAAVWVTLGAPSNYSIWNAPHARLGNACTATWGQAGNTFFVSSIHAETQSSAYSFATPGSAASPCYVDCVANAPGSVPPGSSDVTTGASITTTGASALTIGGAGYAYWNGLTFTCGTSGTPAFNIGNALNQNYSRFDNCSLNFGSGVGAANFNFGDNARAQLYELNNTTFGFTNAGQSISISGMFRWHNTTSAISGTLPTTLFTAQPPNLVDIKGIDLSNFTGTICATNTTFCGGFLIADCSLNSAVTPYSAAASGQAQTQLDIVRSDSSGTNYQHSRYRYQGTQVPSIAITRTGGAAVGSTSVAWVLATTANNKWAIPFEAMPASIWNSTVGSTVNVTMYGFSKGALPNNDQCWMDVEYLGNASYPLGSFAIGTKSNNLANGVAQTADTTSAWGASASAYQPSHTYGAFTGFILAGNASPQQLWFMASHSGSGISGASSSIFNAQADGAQVTDNAGANQIVWQAVSRFSMTATITPEIAGYLSATVKAGQASQTFYIDPLIVLH